MDTTDISKQTRSQILNACEVYENGRKDLLNILEAYERGNLEPSSARTLAIKSIRIDFKTLCSMMDGLGKMGNDGNEYYEDEPGSKGKD